MIDKRIEQLIDDCNMILESSRSPYEDEYTSGFRDGKEYFAAIALDYFKEWDCPSLKDYGDYSKQRQVEIDENDK